MQAFTYKYGDRPLEGYTIQRAAGRGGFGEVYYALSDSGREVALKVVQGFEDIELRGIGQCMNLKSPHLVTIFDVRHNEQGKPFVLMEYVNGPSLRELIDETPAGLGTQKAAFFLREMAKGLTYLHDRGIVHRDLKPGNVFYEDGYVKIGDYGLSKAISASKHSGQTITVGTVHYMAPEIGEGRYDRGIDIYALGCMLYEMLTGQTPYLGASPGEILMKHLVEQPDLSGIEEPFAGAIRKALAKDPKDRFQTVQELVEAIFGAEHVRQSVSCFSPDSLTMVAGRVAQKVATGGAGSSGQIDLGAAAAGAARDAAQPAGAEDAGDPVRRRVAQKLTKVGQRIGRIGDRIGGPFGEVGQAIGEGLQRAGRQIEADRRPGQGGAGSSGAVAADVAPPAAPLAEPAVDPRRDPMRKKARILLCIATAAVLGCGTSALSSHWGGWFLVTWFASYTTIMGAVGGLVLAATYIEPGLKREGAFVRHLAYGGLACLVGGALSLFSMAVADGKLYRIMGERYVPGTVLAIAAALLLVNWWKAIDPARRERIALGVALKAALLGWLVCLVFDGNMPFVIGTLAGIAMAVQARCAYDPQAVRIPRRPRARSIDIDIRMGEQPDGPARRPQPRWQEAGRPLDRPAAALDLRGQPRPLPVEARVGLVIAGVVALGLGLAAVLGVLAGGVHGGDGIALMFLGSSGLLLSLVLLAAARRGWMVNAWATFIRPMLMMVCIAAVVAAVFALGGGGGTLHADEITVAIFFTIFPPILMVILALLPARLQPAAAAAPRGTAAGPGNGRAWSDGYPLPPGVSPHKRSTALLMAACCFLGVSGVQRLYVGKIFTGVLWFFTWGLFGLGQLIDAILILAGHFRDKAGRRLVMWDNAGEFGYPPQAGPPGWQPAPASASPQEQPVAAAPVAPPVGADAVQATPAPAQAPAPSWHPEAWNSQVLSPPRRTNPFLAFLSGLLMIVSIVSGLAGTFSRPAVMVSTMFDRYPAAWYDTFMGGRWQGILDSLQAVISAGLMLLAVIVMIVARRWMGATHMFRAIVGAGGMLAAVAVFRNSMNFGYVDWTNAASLARHGYVQEGLAEILRYAMPAGMVFAGLVLLGSVLVLSWPPRRQEQAPAVGKGV